MKSIMKILTFAVCLLAGVSMTSCLNSDSDPTSWGNPIVKVYTTYYPPYVYFETMDGLIIEPTEESYNASISQGFDWRNYNGQIVQLQYYYDSESPDVVIDDKGIRGVTLNSLSPLNSAVEVVQTPGAANDSINNMPIISLGEENYNGSAIEPVYWDARTLFVPINYFLNSKVHSFTLEYHPYEESVDGTLRLYLQHDKEKDNPTNQVESWDMMLYYGYSYLYYRAFNLSKVENYLMTQGKTMPSSVTIVTYEDDYSLELKDDTETNEYVVTYEDNKD